MKYTKWNITGYDRDAAAAWLRKGVSALMSVLLVSRGITTEEELNELMDNDISSLNDPFLLSGMREAVDRIKLAFDRKEHIGIFGDYDVDGITATCLLTRYFKSKGLKCDNYIPERLEDGYGLRSTGIEKLRKSGAQLIISVDCGVTAYEAADYAASVGLDLIITDHHVANELLPTAVAVINPKLPNQEYPNRYLSGVGVAFKLACAVEGVEKTKEMVELYSDLVAAGTIADVMQLRGENRILVRYGIDRLRHASHIGFEMLGQQAGIDTRTLGTVGMSFMLAPRINAAGRLGRTGIAKDLLMTDDKLEAKELARELCELNYERKLIETNMMDEVEVMMESYPDNDPIVLESPHWHQGVAGVVASRIMEKYNRPAIVICIADGIGHGSCRSLNGFNIYEALKESEDLLISFGGHKYAVGVIINEENIGKLRRNLAESYARAYDTTEEQAESVLNIDFEVIKPGILTIENVQSLSELEPYGNGNPSPKMCMTNAEVDMVIALGRGKHTKLWITKGKSSFECLFFNQSPEDLGVKAGDLVDLAFEPKVNEFRGRRSVQLQLADLKVH